MRGERTGDFRGAAVIFDLDGTLIDTAGDLAAAMNHALACAGRPPVEASAVRHLVGHGARAMLKAGFAAHGAAPDEKAMDGHVADFLDYYLAHIADLSRPFPGAVEALQDLADSGAALAVCTNKREAPARLLLETLGLTDRFVAIVGMDTTARAKPDPLPVRRCLDLAGVARAVFVGDSDTDIRAAANAGLPCLFADFGYGPGDLAPTAFARFGAYPALPALAARALAAAP